MNFLKKNLFPFLLCVHQDSGLRPARITRLPKRFRDELPPAPPDMAPSDDYHISDQGTPGLESGPETEIPHLQSFRTEHDSFGILREYSQGCPSITPDDYHSLSKKSDSPYHAVDPASQSNASRPIIPVPGSSVNVLGRASDSLEDFFAPFRNASIYRLMDWFYGPSTNKSIKELNDLVKDVILAPDFKVKDFIGFDAARQHKIMDDYQHPS